MASKERGLGKGLDALIGDTSLQSQEGATSLPISQIQPGLKQPRKRFEPEAISQLADSIREHGLIQPLTVRRLASGYYQIIAGERRWRASKEAGLSEVPAHIIEADDKKVMELGLIENLQREDLNPIEIANGYKTLMSEHGMTQEDVAQRMGVSRPAVANMLRLLDLPDPVRYLVEEGKLSAGHAKAVLMAPPSCQKKLAQTVVDKDLSVRATEALAKKLAKEPPQQEDDPPISPELAMDDPVLYFRALERDLTEKYGRKVTFKPGKKKGLLQLEYYDLNDLDVLLAALGGLRGGSGK